MKPATLEASNILLPYKLPIQSFAPLIQSIVCLDAAPRGFSRGLLLISDGSGFTIEKNVSSVKFY